MSRESTTCNRTTEESVAARLLPEALDFLRELVEANSHSLNREGVERNADLIRNRFADFGWTEHRAASSREGAGRHLILDAGQPGPAIFLISHLDTVFTAGEQESAGPAWNLEGRRVRGPGVMDIKGGTAMIWLVLRILRETAPETFRAIRWVAAWNAAEELLAPDFSAACLSLAPMAEAALVFEADNAAGTDCFETVHWRSGIVRYHLTCEGRGAHAGNGHENGRNAITGLAAAILEISDWTDYGRNTVVNVGVVRGGEATNRVPDHAEADFEIRFRDRAHLAELEARLAGLVAAPGCSLSIRKESGTAPLDTGPEAGLLESVWSEAGRELGLEVSSGGRRGLSDANYFSEDVPALDGLGPHGGNAHGIERQDGHIRITEYLELDTFAIKAALNARALVRLFASFPKPRKNRRS